MADAWLRLEPSLRKRGLIGIDLTFSYDRPNMAASSKFSYKVCRLFCENRVIGVDPACSSIENLLLKVFKSALSLAVDLAEEHCRWVFRKKKPSRTKQKCL